MTLEQNMCLDGFSPLIAGWFEGFEQHDARAQNLRGPPAVMFSPQDCGDIRQCHERLELKSERFGFQPRTDSTKPQAIP